MSTKETRVKRSIRLFAQNDDNIIKLAQEMGINYSEAVNLIISAYFINTPNNSFKELLLMMVENMKAH